MTRHFSIVATLALASAVTATAFAENIPPAPPTAPIGVSTPAPTESSPTQPQTQQPAPPAQSQPLVAQPRQPQQQQIAPNGPKVLVIPFATLNVPEGEEWIGRGVEESLVADFGHARAFSPVAFKGQLLVEDNATAIALAHKANADYVIRGAAQRVDQNLRLTAQFIDARNGDTLAAATATGSAKDLLKLEDDLASQLRTSAMPIVAAEQQGQLNYIPGNYLPPQTSDAGNGSYYPGYDQSPGYMYTPTYQPTYDDTSAAYNQYPSYPYPDYGYAYGYGYPFYGGFYPSIVFFNTGGFRNHFHRGFDHHDGHFDGRFPGGRFPNTGHFNNGRFNVGFNRGFNGNITGNFSTGFRPVTGPFGGVNVGFNRGIGAPVTGNVSHFGGFPAPPAHFGGGFSGGMRGFGGGPVGGGIHTGGFGGGFGGGGFGGGMHGGGFGGGGFGGGGHR